LVLDALEAKYLMLILGSDRGKIHNTARTWNEGAPP
jgi:hypothetical protein